MAEKENGISSGPITRSRSTNDNLIRMSTPEHSIPMSIMSTPITRVTLATSSFSNSLVSSPNVIVSGNVHSTPSPRMNAGYQRFRYPSPHSLNPMHNDINSLNHHFGNQNDNTSMMMMFIQQMREKDERDRNEREIERERREEKERAERERREEKDRVE